MAMTKKEKAEFAEAIARANTIAALRWTERVEPDVPPPKPGSGVAATEGYFAYLETYGPVRVDLMWSTSIAHGRGGIEEERKRYRSGTQGSMKLHSTKVAALKALRHQVEWECANKLRSIDAAIEQELDSVEKP